MKSRVLQHCMSLVIMILTAVMAHTAQAAVTYLWDGGGTDNNWSSATNWNPDTSAPVSASNTIVQLNGTNRLNSVQDLANPFILNRLDFLNGPSAGSNPAFNLSGSPLQFVADGATQPRITNPRWNTDVIGNAINIPAGTTLNLQIDTYGTTFNGAISGGGAIDKVQNAGALILNNSANSFSGGLTLRGIDNDWYQVSVNASGAMGTGPVSLYGGTLSTNYVNPGGLMFFNTTTHTNAISLFQNSPIFAGNLTSGGTVTLSGGINLNTWTLYLRGCGSGTISGVISGGGTTALNKTDTGTWTLAGTNTFVGRMAVNNGTCRLGAPDALNAAVPVTLAGGTFDLNGCRQTVSQLRGDTTAGKTNTVTSATAATLTVSQDSDTLFDGRLTGLLSLVKTGAGSLVLSNSLSTTTGGITVSNGTLVAAVSTCLGSSTNILVAGGTLDLRAAATISDSVVLSIAAGGAKVSIGVGLTETIDKLFLDGVQQPSGTYGAVGSGAGTETNAFFGGSGKINVLSSLPNVSFVWDGGAADNNWSSGANWTPDGNLPVSKFNTTVSLDGTNHITAVQDLASPFVINRLDFLNGPTGGVKSTFNLYGGPLQFVADGAAQPRITNPREATDLVTNSVTIPTGTTLIMDIGTWGVNFNGVISGGGAIDKLQTAGAISLLNGANSFSGGLTIRAQESDWYMVNVYASGAMGTGPISLYGGALNTNWSNPGGLIFYNTTTHTNAISLFQNSPIAAGSLAGAATVTLNGGIDLGTSTLSLRGGGFGTIGGVISKGGASSLNKIDGGVWTLSGANTFTGRVTVASGTLRLGSAGVMDPAVPVTVSGGIYDLGGLSMSNSALTVSAGSIMNGALAAASYTVTDAGFVSASLGGSSGLTKSGAGTLSLRGTQTFTGPLAVSGGKVETQPGAPVPGSALWMDAANPASLAKNTDGTGGTPAPGGTVGRWTSLSGSLWAYDQGSRPTYQTNVVNGLPVLRFSGSGLYFNSLVAAQGSTVFIVFRDRNPTGLWRNALGSDGQTPTSGWMHSLNNLNNRCLTKGGGAMAIDSSDSGTNWAVQVAQLQVGDYRLWVNENAYGPNTSTTNFTPFTRLGDGGLTADFGEVLIYTNLLSASDRVNTIRYLRRKWMAEGDAFTVTNSLSPQVAAAVKAGTVLDFWGGAQTLSSLSGSGTVTGGTVTVTGALAAGDTNSVASVLTVGGNLTLAAGMTNAVDYVSGTSDVVNVTGTLSVTGAGTVALSLNGQTPPPQMTLFTFGTILGDSNLSAWSVLGAGLGPYQTRVRVVGNSLVLKVFRGGTLISVR